MIIANGLKLNVDKTQFMWFGTRQKLGVVEEYMKPVKDLGIWLDPCLTMSDHVKNLCRSCFYQFLQIRGIRKYLTTESSTTLMHSFVCSIIDYCHSVLYGASSYLLNYVHCAIGFKHISQNNRRCFQI